MRSSAVALDTAAEASGVTISRSWIPEGANYGPAEVDSLRANLLNTVPARMLQCSVRLYRL